TDALHVEGARREDGTGVAVPLRVEGRARLAGRAPRHVDAHRLLQRHVRRDALVVAPGRMFLDRLADVVDRVPRRLVEIVDAADGASVEADLRPPARMEGDALGAHGLGLEPFE